MNVAQLGRLVIIGPFQVPLQREQAVERPSDPREALAAQRSDRVEVHFQKVHFTATDHNSPLSFDQQPLIDVDPKRFLRAEVVGDVNPPAIARADLRPRRDAILPGSRVVLTG